MSVETPTIGYYFSTGDGGYRLYTGTERGWVVCDDRLELEDELEVLTNGKASYADEEE